MAIARSALTSGSSATNGTSYSSASITPTANNLVLLAVFGEATVDGNDGFPSSVSGNGLTWVKIGEAAGDTFSDVSLWRAMGSSPSAGTIDLTFATTQTGVLWAIQEFSGIDTGGTNGSAAVVQFATTAGGSGANFLVTLAAFSNANNATFGAFGSYTDSINVMTHTPGSGFTELYDQELNPDAWKDTLYTEWRTGNDTTVDATMSQVADAYGGIAIEIKEAAAGTVVNGTTASLVLTEYVANVNAANNISGTTDALVITEYAATVSLGINIDATVDSLILTEYPANVNAAINRTGSLATLSLTEYAANVNAAINRAATFDSLVITTYPATVQLDTGTNIAAGFDALVITPYGANVNAAKNISSGVDTLIITTYAATVGLDVGPTIDGATTDVITTNYGEGSYYSVGGGAYYKF